MALIGTNGQGVGTSVFQQWSNNCKKNLPSDQMELFEKFVDNAYEAMEEGIFIIILSINVVYCRIQLIHNTKIKTNDMNLWKLQFLLALYTISKCVD